MYLNSDILQLNEWGGMSSIVIELQRDAMSQQVPITDLLRRAYVVAKKLKVREFEEWINSEMNGYGDTSSDQVPGYRNLHGTVMALNPYHGWRPIMFENNKHEKNLSTRKNSQSVSEIEHLVESTKKGETLQVAYPGSVAQELMDAIGLDMQPALHISSAALVRILDTVRNIVLEWALKLEEDGILGDGLSFSEKEVATAANANYTLNFIAGDIVNSQLQQGTNSSDQSRK